MSLGLPGGSASEGRTSHGPVSFTTSSAPRWGMPAGQEDPTAKAWPAPGPCAVPLGFCVAARWSRVLRAVAKSLQGRCTAGQGGTSREAVSGRVMPKIPQKGQAPGEPGFRWTASEVLAEHRIPFQRHWFLCN